MPNESDDPGLPQTVRKIWPIFINWCVWFCVHHFSTCTVCIWFVYNIWYSPIIQTSIHSSTLQFPPRSESECQVSEVKPSWRGHSPLHHTRHRCPRRKSSRRWESHGLSELMAWIPLKNMSSSVGMMTFPTEWKVIKFHGSKAPTRVYPTVYHLFNRMLGDRLPFLL